MLISVLPLDFRGRLRVVRTMFIPGALHGIEASWLAVSSLRKLRSSISIFKVVWSRRIYRLLDMVRKRCPGHGPVHLLVASATYIGFQWDPQTVGWVRLGLPASPKPLCRGGVQRWSASG